MKPHTPVGEVVEVVEDARRICGDVIVTLGWLGGRKGGGIGRCCKGGSFYYKSSIDPFTKSGKRSKKKKKKKRW